LVAAAAVVAAVVATAVVVAVAVAAVVVFWAKKNFHLYISRSRHIFVCFFFSSKINATAESQQLPLQLLLLFLLRPPGSLRHTKETKKKKRREPREIESVSVGIGVPNRRQIYGCFKQ